ncbi:hypothetical protein [uncultured Dubosiella sp.]|uniref:hypothetical protein n=1 Tax=uncultured Dubosiella sp. TaxID=1937011 RepID=UPI00272DE634|nr:hypothetical protein [uncultured Dubosiella sp.]
MSEEKMTMKEAGEKLLIKCNELPCCYCPIAKECNEYYIDTGEGTVSQERLGEIWAEAHGYVKKEEVPTVNEEFSGKLARYMDSTATKTDLKQKGVSGEDWMSEPGNKEDWKNWLKENLFVGTAEKVEESEEEKGEFDTEPNFVLNVNENFIDDIYRFLDVNIHNKNAYWTPKSAWFSFSDGEEGFKKWFLFNLLANSTVTVEEKITDDGGELDPTPLEVMNSFGFYRHYLAGKVIECVARNDFDRAKEYQSKIKNPPQSVPGLIDVIRNWKLTRSESLFLLDFIEEFACDHEIDQFEEIEVLRYIAEKGALMEDQNVSNDDN